MRQMLINAPAVHLPQAAMPAEPAAAVIYDATHVQEGDPILCHQGHDISDQSDSYDPFRVFFQNVDGLRMVTGDTFLERAVGFLRDIDPSVICLAETNTDWSDSSAYHRYNAVLRRGFSHVRTRTSSSGLTQKSVYQPGGTATSVVRKWVGRVMKSGSNREGSFSWMQMRGRWGRKITVITCYRVSQSTGAGLGEGTAFIQQESLLRMKGQEYPIPRAYCLEAVQSFIE